MPVYSCFSFSCCFISLCAWFSLTFWVLLLKKNLWGGSLRPKVDVPISNQVLSLRLLYPTQIMCTNTQGANLCRVGLWPLLCLFLLLLYLAPRRLLFYFLLWVRRNSSSFALTLRTSPSGFQQDMGRSPLRPSARGAPPKPFTAVAQANALRNK